jgi:hypothetical protein
MGLKEKYFEQQRKKTLPASNKKLKNNATRVLQKQGFSDNQSLRPIFPYPSGPLKNISPCKSTIYKGFFCLNQPA